MFESLGGWKGAGYASWRQRLARPDHRLYERTRLVPGKPGDRKSTLGGFDAEDFPANYIYDSKNGGEEAVDEAEAKRVEPAVLLCREKSGLD